MKNACDVTVKQIGQKFDRGKTYAGGKTESAQSGVK